LAFLTPNCLQHVADLVPERKPSPDAEHQSNTMGNLLFLSHAGIDSEAAMALAKLIENAPAARQHGLRVWIDKRDLVPGRPWQDQLAEVIENRSTAFAVYLGRNGVVNWVQSEVRLALSLATTRPDYPFIPIISADSDGSAALAGFARQYQGVRYVESGGNALSKLINAVLQLDAGQGAQLVRHPYKGLLAFETRDTHIFFGRAKETKDLLERIDKHPLVMVIGDSGSGKSSLVKAGLIPSYLGSGLDATESERRYDRTYVAVETRPLTNPNPFGALADDLEGKAKTFNARAADIAQLKRFVRERAAQSVYDALRLAVPDDAEILLFVDQFEELFTSR
jgi:hypothetical protein